MITHEITCFPRIVLTYNPWVINSTKAKIPRGQTSAWARFSSGTLEHTHTKKTEDLEHIFIVVNGKTLDKDPYDDDDDETKKYWFIFSRWVVANLVAVRIYDSSDFNRILFKK